MSDSYYIMLQTHHEDGSISTSMWELGEDTPRAKISDMISDICGPATNSVCTAESMRSLVEPVDMVAYGPLADQECRGCDECRDEG